MKVFIALKVNGKGNNIIGAFTSAEKAREACVKQGGENAALMQNGIPRGMGVLPVDLDLNGSGICSSCGQESNAACGWCD